MHSLVLIPVKLSFKQVKVRETSDITKQLSQTKSLNFLDSILKTGFVDCRRSFPL